MANSYIHKFLFPLPFEVSLTPPTQKRLYYNILDKLSENVTASKFEVKLKKGQQHKTNVTSHSNFYFYYMYVIANTINFYYIHSLTKIIPTVLRILAGNK